MPTLLVHALVASAVQGLICLPVLGTGIDNSLFYAAMAGILVNLDHRSNEERSSAFHSLFAVLVAALVLTLSTPFLSNTLFLIPAISLLVGFTSHVILDMTDHKGVYVSPWSARRVTAFQRFDNRRFPKRRRTGVCLTVVSGLVLLVLVCI